MHFDLVEIIKSVGLLGIVGIVFAESGLFFGFFLPGDSLLFTAGFLASQGYLNIWWLVIGCAVAAIVGDNVGYTFGHKVGAKLFNQPNSKLFKKEHLLKAQKFYEQHGPATIIIARFMPVIRTFAPIVAGAANMHYSTFMTYNTVGGLIWGAGLPLLGYWLGNLIPDVDKYLLPIVGAIVVLSVAPGVWHYVHEKYYKKDKQILESVVKVKK
jgi:membrane-associated protein